MIPSLLLSPEVQSFILQHELEDPRQIVLNYSTVHGFPGAVIAEQISGRRKAREKIPTFYYAQGIVYPPGINMEQCSSESTARYKNIVVGEMNKKGVIADLTGGFGVDSFFFSKNFGEVFYIEPDGGLLEVVAHNHTRLGAEGIRHFQTTAEIFLADNNRMFDCIYLDPSRRTRENKKVSSFADCQPEVTSLIPRIFELTGLLMIKASPLMDIQHAIGQLQGVKKVVVISVDNECRELLFLCEKDFHGEPVIDAVNLKKTGEHISFPFQHTDERSAVSSFSEPLRYLYEPNSSILKAGAFKLIGKKFGLHKIHANTHLYTSESQVPTFPGKVFRITAQVRPDRKELSFYFPEGKANLTTRNYPLSVHELKMKTGLKDGGDKFLIGFSGINKKFLVVAERIS